MTYYFLHMFLFLAVTIFPGCTKPKENPLPLPPEPIVYEYDMPGLEFHTGFDGAEIRGVPENSEIVEASGIAVSRSNHSMIWVHNDSGHENQLFVMGENGEDSGVFAVEPSVNRDWEDMAAGPGPVAGVTYLYVGDFGDNLARYEVISVYRFPEPDLSVPLNGSEGLIEEAERLDFVYPDGQPRDAETLMIDPLTKDIFIVSKRDEKSILYIATWPHDTERVDTLREVGIFPFNQATGGDISANGMEIAVKTYFNIFYWLREPGEPVYEALGRQPLLLPYTVEPQGESFGWMPDGSGYYTISEKVAGIEPVLYFYKRGTNVQ